MNEFLNLKTITQPIVLECDYGSEYRVFVPVSLKKFKNEEHFWLPSLNF